MRFGARSTAATFSCVIDDQPALHLEALRWFTALTRVAGVPASELVIHVVGRTDTDVLRHLGSSGVTVRSVKPFDERSPHCNKISGAISLAACRLTGLVVLTDADVAVCEDPRRHSLPRNSVALKPVDAPNPPLEVLRAVFAEARIRVPPLVSLDFFPDQQTMAGNGNGGFVLVPAKQLPPLAEAWSHWAQWLLDRIELLGSSAVHVDQVALTLALAANRTRTGALELRWNTPTHMPAWLEGRRLTPAVLHYHRAVEPTGLLSATHHDDVDRQIDVVNAAIAHVWSEAFPNETFWEWRYRSNPTLGSGVGSRGRELGDKRVLLESVFSMVRPADVLDVGCGDGEAMRGLGPDAYVGLDLSAEALVLARRARPSGSFRLGTIEDATRQADLTICLDVLIHQPDHAEYLALVSRLVGSARRALLVSGYDAAPPPSPMIHFHEPLSATLAATAPGASVVAVREEHNITTFLVTFSGRV